MPEVEEIEITTSTTPSRLESSSIKILEEEVSVSPKIRSLSMSQNLALSVLDEVGHMIHPASCTHKKTSFDDITAHSPISLRRSSSVSSLTRLQSMSSETSPQPLTSFDSCFMPTEDFSTEYQEDDIYRIEPESSLTAAINITDTDPPSIHSSVGKSSSSSNSSSSCRSEILIGIVVSRWDNIVGPQCIYLWTEDRTSTFYPGRLPIPLAQHVKYVTDHTVDHHDVDGNLVSPSTIRSALCLVQDLELAYLSLSIRVPSSDSLNGGAELQSNHNSPWGSNGVDGDTNSSRDRPAVSVPHAVAVLAKLKFLHHFLLMRPLISNWLAEFSPKISVLLCKNQLQSSMINSWCAELCKTMSSIWKCWWQQQSLISDSNDNSSTPCTFSATTTEPETRSSRSGVTLFKRKIVKDIPHKGRKSEDYWDYLPPFSGKLSLDTMLTSHLSTSGTSIVVGSDVDAINQVIRFLLCFSKIDEGYCSRYVLPTLPDTFMKGIFVQGLIFGEIGEKSISVNQITSNLYPSTHIEINGKCPKVRQNSIINHRQRREATLIQELLSYWNSSYYTSPTTELFPQQVKEVAGFVSKFLTELTLVKPEMRFARLLLFRRSLHAKAICLITYLQSIRLKPEKEIVGLLKTLKDTLRLDDAEYLIVQITAEKIRPGVLAMIRSY